MFLKLPKPTTDPRLRSLLQKAARRGFTDIVDRTFLRLYQNGDKTWLRSRAIVITFEECWPLAASLSIDKESSSKIEALLSVSKVAKQKDAAGLGALAYAYQEGDRSMLDYTPNPKLLNLVSEALLRPAPFFDWIRSQSKSETSYKVIDAAQRYLPAATWPWDKACILAGALLSTKNSNIPVVEPIPGPKEKFPFWIALDKHTPQGKLVLTKTAEKVRSSYRQLIWAGFYCESARVNKLLPSPWWEAEKMWRLHRAGLTVASAESLWSRALSFIRDYLKNEAVSLQQMIDTNQEVPSGPDVQNNLFKSH